MAVISLRPSIVTQQNRYSPGGLYHEVAFEFRLFGVHF